MPRKKNPAPELRLHRHSGHYYLLLDGVRHYLGKDQEAAESLRRRMLAERLLRGAATPPDAVASGLTVAEVCNACDAYARAYYSAGQLPRVYQALEAVSQLYGPTPADRFDQVALAAVREHLLARPHQRKPHLTLSRNYVNRLVGVVQTLWAWAATRGLVPGEKAQLLQLVRSVREGKGGREVPDVVSVPPEVVEATLPRLGPVPRAMVRLQQATGMRPGEICHMLRGEISTRPDEPIRTVKGITVRAVEADGKTIWVYAPGKHKTAWKGRSRIVCLGPQAQEVLRPFLDRPADAHLFSPAEADGLRLQALREARQSKVQPSQADRKSPRPKKRPGSHYTTSSYGQAVARACEGREPRGAKRGRAALPGRPEIPHWHPNQIRHAVGTAVNEEFDQHHAQATLGHSSPNTTRLYIDAQLKKAAAVAAKLG